MTYVAHVIRDLQIVDETIVKLRKKVENVENVVACDFVQVTVCQSSDIAVRLAESGMDAGIFAENVVFAWKIKAKNNAKNWLNKF